MAFSQRIYSGEIFSVCGEAKQQDMVLRCLVKKCLAYKQISGQLLQIGRKKRDGG
jgi:hypothetical protein